MSGLLPVAVYGLKVPSGDVMVPAMEKFPATFRITMAAIDPSAEPEHTGTANGNGPARATLKVVYDPNGSGEEDESENSEDQEEYLQKLLAGGDSDDEDDEDEDESSSDDEEKNGGPSDPSKTKKARKEAALQEMMKALAEQNDSDDEMEEDNSPRTNGVTKKAKVDKGKGKATDEDMEKDDSEDGSEESLDDMEEVVLCTLDPEKTYQQPLDITFGEDQRVYFKVSGTHAVYLTGNYVISADDGHNHKHELYDGEDEEDEYDMSPDEDELEDDEESDELDELEDPRITEVATVEEEEVPKLVKKEDPVQKGKNKRAREDSSDNEAPASLDAIMAKSIKPAKPAEPATNGTTNGEPKLSKKQLKKLKNNAGKAVETAAEGKGSKKEDSVAGAKDSPVAKGDKKVQFAKNLEQGPAASQSTTKLDSDKSESETGNKDSKPKASSSVKTIQGVKIDDKKLGSGPAAKKGNKVGMRYIGKLKDGKVFDANKKGKPFTFTVGSGDVIKGWDIGVTGMSVGGERRIVIPAELAYGKKQMPGIPANSELTFDLKVLKIN
ncbi:hypothetical protein N7G274_002753 [Stereocaulon virgatum]|uniref:peptidylprolyl isomerase n=1 Tax=Stereocaulon virgatum TaxID=373712 RepID=A0ABR4ANF8_9LECA